MLASHERQVDIVAIAMKAGHVSVTSLATQFGVTPETIRRDLKILEAQGKVSRVHGGAVSTASELQEPELSDKTFSGNAVSHVREKRAIAKAAAELLPPDPMSIFLDAGSSTGYFVEQLAATVLSTRTRPTTSSRRELSRDITVVTTSLSIASQCSDVGLPKVILVGGRVRPHSKVAVGDSTVASLAQLRADVAIMGTNGFSKEHGFSTPDPSEAAVKHAMIRGAHKVFLLADSSKSNKDFLVTFAGVSDIDVLISDALPDSSFLGLLSEHNVQVVCPS